MFGQLLPHVDVRDGKAQYPFDNCGFGPVRDLSYLLDEQLARHWLALDSLVKLY